MGAVRRLGGRVDIRVRSMEWRARGFTCVFDREEPVRHLFFVWPGARQPSTVARPEMWCLGRSGRPFLDRHHGARRMGIAWAVSSCVS